MAAEHYIVVGGTTGTGRVLVRMLSERKQEISLIGRHASAEVQQKLRGVHFYPTDLADPAATRATLEQCVARCGNINHLVFFQRYRGKGDSWAGEFQVTLSATKQVVEFCADHFDPAKNNAVVMIGSLASRLVFFEQPVSYHMAKAAMSEMVRYYAVTLGSRGVRVNSVSPDTVIKEESGKLYEENPELKDLYNTITPLGRMGRSEDVAHVVEFLCSPQSSFVTGQDIVVDGGLSLQGHAALARRVSKLDRLKITR